MASQIVKIPWHLWPVGVIALLFNAIGVFDFVMNMINGARYQASAGMTPEQIAHYQSFPVWMLLVWFLGVSGAFFWLYFVVNA